MRQSNPIATASGMSLPSVLFLLLLTLKLTDHIAWSWWWVTAPIWGPLALFVVLVVIFLAADR